MSLQNRRFSIPAGDTSLIAIDVAECARTRHNAALATRLNGCRPAASAFMMWKRQAMLILQMLTAEHAQPAGQHLPEAASGPDTFEQSGPAEFQSAHKPGWPFHAP